MIISVDYQSDRKDMAGEIRCPINKFGYIQHFIKKHPDKRYVIQMRDEVDTTRQIEFLKAIGVEYTFACKKLKDLQILLALGEPAYLDHPISDWETFTDLKSKGVTDIYIDGPLGFQCSALKKGKGNIKIRTSPVVSVNASTFGVRGINSFFIRPEDIGEYEGIIDILDFQVNDKYKEDVLYTIYDRKEFNYDLHTLIIELDKQYNINNILLSGNDFAHKRLDCGQACKNPNYRNQCHYCSSVVAIAKQTIDILELIKKKN